MSKCKLQKLMTKYEKYSDWDLEGLYDKLCQADENDGRLEEIDRVLRKREIDWEIEMEIGGDRQYE